MSQLPKMTASQARRAALAAQGFATSRPGGRVDVRHLRRVLRTTRVVQLDAVNVSVRAHYMPSFSRLGPYDQARLDELLWRDGEAFEYDGHAASVMPMELHPLMRHRMRGARPGRSVRRLLREHPGYVDRVHEEFAERGPMSVGDLEDPGAAGGTWWGWRRGRVAVHWLHQSGRLAVAERDDRFRLTYDLADRVIPPDVLSRGDVPQDAARRELLLLAARAFGVATAPDLADYWRTPVRPTRAALSRLADAGELERVDVDGWPETAFCHPQARVPRRIRARALLSPFDPVVWFRERTERLFHFDYRLEIYVPAERRRYGYYVLPFLLDDRLVARVDLKSDREAGVLRVLGAYAEPGEDPRRVVRELADELRLFAEWQGLDDVAVAATGDLAPALTKSV